MTNKNIYLAGGCFWGTEHFFKQIAGVVETEVGFANGQTDNPTYEQVYTDTTGYAETVHVTYDPDKVCLEFLLHMFFVAIDPTSLNKPIASQRKVLNYTPNLPAKRSSVLLWLVFILSCLNLLLVFFCFSPIRSSLHSRTCVVAFPPLMRCSLRSRSVFD